MASKSHSLVGRTVLIDWHSFNADRFGGDLSKLAATYADGSHNALYTNAAKRFGREAEIVSFDSEKGWQLLFADGKLEFGNEMFFSVLPKKPAPLQGWEYLTGQGREFTSADLNKFGADGWELVAMVASGDAFNMIFKRPLR